MMFTKDEHDRHLEIASQIYQSFSPKLKELINDPLTPYAPGHRKERKQPKNHLFFDMHTKRGKKTNPDPHIVIWFRSRDNRRYIEIAINSENKPSNKRIQKKIGENKFWDLLKKAKEFELRLFKKNVYINKNGFIYSINSSLYDWSDQPLLERKSGQLLLDNQDNIDLWVQGLNKFDSKNYKPNNCKNGHPWCDNAIFAFCIVKEYDYNLVKYRKYAENFSEFFELYSYLLEK